MKQITRRVKELEKRTGKREPITINIRKTVIGMDGAVEREKSRAIHLGAEGHGD